MILVISAFSLVFALILVGILAASETALFSLSALQIKSLEQDPDQKKKRVGQLLSKPRDLLVTILIVNVAMSIFVQNIVASTFGRYEAWWVNVIVPLALTLFIGEVIPKSIALSNSLKIALRVAPIILSLQKILGPLRSIFIAITQPISRFFFFFLKKEPEISIDELRYALKTSEQYGVVNLGEAQLIAGYLDLEEYLVKEVMTPRAFMHSFNLDDSIDQLKELVSKHRVSRFPVFAEDHEQLLGILKIENLFCLKEPIQSGIEVVPFLKKPFFIPESLPAKTLFNQFNQLKKSMAIVVDEYGAISGLITKEDLVKRLIGENILEKELHFKKASQDVIIASAAMELSDFNEHFSSDLISESNMASIGGWLIEQLGEIPKSGTKWEKEGFFFHVLSASPKKIKTLYIRKMHKGKKT